MSGIRVVGLVLLLTASLAQVGADAQGLPDVPGDLQRTYVAFAAAMVEGDADRAIEFYAEDAVVLVDHEHVYRGRQAIREEFLADFLAVAGGADEAGAGTEIGVDRVVVGERVVTLTGRYANQAGAAGVYSNTWERKADGAWKLAASVLTFESSDGTPSCSSGDSSVANASHRANDGQISAQLRPKKGEERRIRLKTAIRQHPVLSRESKPAESL